MIFCSESPSRLKGIETDNASLYAACFNSSLTLCSESPSRLKGIETCRPEQIEEALEVQFGKSFPFEGN